MQDLKERAVRSGIANLCGSAVAFALSRLQDDPNRLESYFLKGYSRLRDWYEGFALGAAQLGSALSTGKGQG